MMINKNNNCLVILNHKLSEEQIKDLQTNYGITQIDYLPEELKYLWSNINPSAFKEELHNNIEPITDLILDYDYVIVQGEMTATYRVVRCCKYDDIIALAACSKRESIEKVINNKTVKSTVFKHIQFREY